MLAIAFLVIVGIVGVIAYIDVDLWVKPAKSKKKKPKTVKVVQTVKTKNSEGDVLSFLCGMTLGAMTGKHKRDNRKPW